MRKNKKTLSDRPVLIDLFAGAGGLSIGLEQAGFKLVAATDWDHWSCETLRANHKGAFVAEGDINEVDLDDFAGKLSADEVDLIVGGPPCQGFSALGKRSKSDPRNQLWRQYMRFVEYFNPKVFLMENVPELLKSEEYAQIKKTAEKLGYQVKEKILFAPDYGVPQKGEPKFPNPTHALPGQMTLDNYNCAPWKNVRDAISDLPLDPDGNNWHVGRNPTKKSLKRYKSVPPGGNRFNLPQDLMPECWKRKKTGSTDVFGRLEWDKPSLTVRTEFFKPEKGRYLHPEAHRPITIREAARLQTIPDSYILKGSHLEVAKQIGNAVPCELARNIGEELLKLFNADSDSVQDKRVYGSTGFEGLLAYQQP